MSLIFSKKEQKVTFRFVDYTDDVLSYFKMAT